MDRYIQETNMLDYSNANIQKLIQARAWQKLDTFGCIKLFITLCVMKSYLDIT